MRLIALAVLVAACSAKEGADDRSPSARAEPRAAYEEPEELEPLPPEPQERDAPRAPETTRDATDAPPKRAVSRYDPPADIPHLEDTSPELRRKIDDLITTLLDVDAGRDSLRAKEQLVLIGKPAFPRILGAMAKIRDVITGVDSIEERTLGSSLRLCDVTLREMDGYLNAFNRPEIRPGSVKAYIAYICRLHYKRWKTELEKMDTMPGPFDPSK